MGSKPSLCFPSGSGERCSRNNRALFALFILAVQPMEKRQSNALGQSKAGLWLQIGTFEITNGLVKTATIRLAEDSWTL